MVDASLPSARTTRTCTQTLRVGFGAGTVSLPSEIYQSDSCVSVSPAFLVIVRR